MDSNSTTPYPEEPFLRSKPIDPARLKESGAFTQFAARFSTSNDLATAGGKLCQADFKALMGDVPESTTGESPEGNINSLVFVDCLPERMEMVSYFIELTLLHDDFATSKGDELVVETHERLDYALDPEATETPDELSLTLKMKCLYSEIILKCCEIDTNTTLDMVKAISSHWLKLVDREPMPTSSLEAYFRKRIGDAGARSYWCIIAFGQGTRVSPEELEMVEPLAEAFEVLFLATNDYYTWQKEKTAPVHRIWNAVLFFMKSLRLSEQDAILELKNFIIAEEKRFLQNRNRFCASHPTLPPHVKRMVNSLEPAIAGYHFWCSVSPRENAWRQNPPPPFELEKIVSPQLAVPIAEDNSDAILALEHPCVTEDSAVEPYPDRSYGTSMQRADLVLTAPACYVRSMPSKNVRSQLIDAFNLWYEIPRDVLTVIKTVVNDLHDSSLILDDIQDQSPLRRGKIATHYIYGEAQSINSATYMFVKATKQIHALQNPALTSILLEELSNLFLGQAVDLNWKYTMQCPTKSDYLAMVAHKTGSMFHLILRMMATVSRQNKSIALDSLSNTLGQWYQVRDDYMNLKGGDYSKQKGFCEDLDERKFSYPVICSCTRDNWAKDIVLGVFRQRNYPVGQPLPIASKLQILALMEDNGAMNETYTTIQKLRRKVQTEVERLESSFDKRNPILRLLIRTLSDVPEPEKPYA